MKNPTKLYTQITRYDIETQIRHEFRTCKFLNEKNVSNIVSWIKSRGKKINVLHCFIFLRIYCPKVIEHLDIFSIYHLMDKMSLKVREALGGQLLKRNFAMEKNSNKWGNKDFQDFYYFDAEDRCFIKRANKYQVKFPLPSKKNFDKYEEAMWSRKVYMIAKDNNPIICERYINAYYDDNFYYCPIGSEERYQ